MAIKRFNGSVHVDVSTAKRFDGSAWNNLTIAKRFDGSTWQNLLSGSLPSTDTASRKSLTFALGSKATYWDGGGKDSQYPNELIQGAYAGSKATSRSTLLFFDMAAIRAAIPSGAQVEKAELYLQRTASSHGTATAYACIKTAALSAAPSSFTGDGLTDAAEAMPAMNIGAGLWIELNSAAVESITGGSDFCLAVSAGSDYSLKKYVRYARAATKLRITYLT